MYSRSRSGSTEEQYRSNLPPVYSGSRFRSGVREEIPAEDTRRNPPRAAEEKAVVSAPCGEKDPPSLPLSEEESGTVPTDAAERSGKAEGFLHSFGQEELILIALLLLLSAEHERAMDVIVILLILLGIQ